MHYWIYQLSTFEIEEEMDANTLEVGETDLASPDYCNDISKDERTKAIGCLVNSILPKGMFTLKDPETLVYNGGFSLWEDRECLRLREMAEGLQTGDRDKFRRDCRKLNERLSDPLGCGCAFYPYSTEEEDCPVSSENFMYYTVKDMKEGDCLHIGGIVNAHQ